MSKASFAEKNLEGRLATTTTTVAREGEMTIHLNFVRLSIIIRIIRRASLWRATLLLEVALKCYPPSQLAP